jgi:2-C-methyl-D-erythritol 4-phosphate cytidylyltransferase
MPDAPAAHRTGSGAALVLLAAGAGTRFGHGTNKVFLPLAGRSVLGWSLHWTASIPAITRTLLVVRDAEQASVRDRLRRESPGRAVELVPGGETRHRSEYNALAVLAAVIEDGEIDTVVVHDAARPLAGAELFTGVIDAARATGAAVPARPVAGAVPVDGTDAVAAESMICVQTPQAFSARELLRCYLLADTEGFEGSDTASCVERFGDTDVHWLRAPATNIKITFEDDLLVAQHLLERRLPGARTTAAPAPTPR